MSCNVLDLFLFFAIPKIFTDLEMHVFKVRLSVVKALFNELRVMSTTHSYASLHSKPLNIK